MTSATAAPQDATPPAVPDPVKHRILFAEYGKGENRLVELDAGGKLVWQHKFPSIAVIFQPIADGHVVFAYGGNPTGGTDPYEVVEYPVGTQPDPQWKSAAFNMGAHVEGSDTLKMWGSAR